MGTEDVRWVWTADESQVVTAINNVINSAEKGEVATESFGKSADRAFGDFGKPLKEADQELKNTVKSMTSFKDRLEEIKQRTQAVNEENIELRKELLQVENAYKKATRTGKGEVDALKKRMDVLRSSIKANNIELSELRLDAARVKQFGSAVGEAGNKMSLTVDQARNLTFQINDVVTGLLSGQRPFQVFAQQGTQITQIFGGAGNTMRFFGQQALGALKQVLTLRGGLLLLGGSITAILAIALVAFLKRASEESQVFTRVLGGLKGAFDVVIERSGAFLEFLGNIISGPAGYGAAAEALGRATDNIGEAVKNGYTQGAQYAKTLADIDKEQKKAEVSSASYEKSLVRLQDIASNENKTFGERASALRKIGAIESEIANNNVKFTKARRDAAAFAAQSDLSSKAAREEARKTEIEYQKALAESENVSTRTAAALRQLSEQQKQESLQRQRELQENLKRAQEIRDAVLEANAKLGGQAEVVAFQFDQAIRKIKELETEAKKLGLNLDFSALFDIASFQQTIDFDKALGLDKLDKIPNEIAKKVKEANTEITGLQPVFVESLGGARNYVEELGRAIEAQNEAIKRNLAEIGENQKELTENQKQFIADSIIPAFQEVSNFFIEGTNLQIAAQDAVIARIKETTDTLKEQLNEQKRLKEQGFRNDVDGLERRLEEENQKLAKAQAERLALERKAAQQQLIADSLIQASQVGVTVARLLAEGAKGFVPGLLIAAAAVPLVFSILARAKANAAKFSEVPKFRKGTNYLEGNSHEHGGVNIEAEGGERILSRRLNDQIGGRAVTNEELVRLFKIGATVTEQAKNLSTPVNQVLQNAGSLNQQQQRIQIVKQEMEVDAMRRAYKEAAMESAHLITSEMINYWKSRPIEYYDASGNKVIEREKGGVVHIDRIKEPE